MEKLCTQCNKGYVSTRQYKEDEFKTDPVTCEKCGMTIFTNDIVPSMKTVKTLSATFDVKREFCSNVMCNYEDTERVLLVQHLKYP